jgi:methylthioribulose-1-phosphate dehydratase
MNNFKKLAQEIIEVGHILYQQGLVPATSGNFSARLTDGNIAITVSGTHKARLTETDIMIVDAQGNPLDERRPSAETGLHIQIYQHFPEVGAILHPHSMNAVLLSRRCPDCVILTDYELLKAFPEVDSHAVNLNIPVFANDQNIPRLRDKVGKYLARREMVFGYIIAGHGFYTWGTTLNDALRHVEALDYLLGCELRQGELV